MNIPHRDTGGRQPQHQLHLHPPAEQDSRKITTETGEELAPLLLDSRAALRCSASHPGRSGR